MIRLPPSAMRSTSYAAYMMGVGKPVRPVVNCMCTGRNFLDTDLLTYSSPLKTRSILSRAS